MKRTKVVHLTSVFSPYDFRIFHKHCKSLVRAGYEVTVVAPHSRDEVVEGVRIKAVPKPNGRLRRMTLTVWRVYREAVRQGADVYYFCDPELIPVGMLLRLRGKKVVYDIREVVPLEFLTKHYLPRWARSFCGGLLGRVQGFAVPRLSAIIAATPSIAAQFHSTKKHALVIVQNFPSLDELASEDDLPWHQRQNWAVYVGEIEVVRGIREMVSAMALVPDNLGASLKIAGAFGPPSLQDEVSQLPGWRRTEYIGLLDRPRLWRLLARARIGLVTMHPTAHHFVAWPVKLFEYMCAGIPVIASDFPLWRDIVEGAGCGLLVNPLNPEAIARAIEYLLSHPAEAEAMGRRGRHAVEKQYNWGIEESKLLNCYADLLRSPA